MKKTKIICTIGPSSINYKTMKEMVLAGMNVVRINLSHAKLEDMETILRNVKKLRTELKIALPIMLDTRGPEVRVKTFKTGSAMIKKGQQFVFTGREVEGDENIVSINMPELVKSVKAGDKILACDGLLKFAVQEIKGKDIITRAVNSGVISNRKSLFVPNVHLKISYLNDLDKQDILWGIKNNVEYVAASFVNSKDDVDCLRNFILKNGGDLKIISKVESALGVKNLDEIIFASDGVMVARGDLGVEMSIEKLPAIQKLMIKKATLSGKCVITATEMLESMISNTRPTRAEVSDVANAVYDGSDAIMLSGETASGKYPVEAVKTMAKVATETEKHINYSKKFMESKWELETVTDLISHSAVNASFQQNIKAIVIFTASGLSAKMVSRFRPVAPVVAMTPDDKTFRAMEMLWGITPVKTPNYSTAEQMFKIANEFVAKTGFAKTGDLIVVTSGAPKTNGGTNLIKIDEVK